MVRPTMKIYVIFPKKIKYNLGGPGLNGTMPLFGVQIPSRSIAPMLPATRHHCKLLSMGPGASAKMRTVHL